MRTTPGPPLSPRTTSTSAATASTPRSTSSPSARRRGRDGGVRLVWCSARTERGPADRAGPLPRVRRGDDRPLAVRGRAERRLWRGGPAGPPPPGRGRRRRSEEGLGGAYGGWYRRASGRRFGIVGDELLRRTRGSLAARLDAIAPPGPVLDVGAGDGTLIDALAERGRAATGLERAATRADLRPEPIEAIDGEWAAVVFWHSLEHLPAPGAAIRHAARLLAPRGVVVVAVPDAGSLQARAFGDRWLHL